MEELIDTPTFAEQIYSKELTLNKANITSDSVNFWIYTSHF